MQYYHKVKLKKLKLERDTKKKYYQDYDLDNMIRNTEIWKYAEPMVLEDEKLLVSLSYYYIGDVAEQENGKDWRGRNSFIFHIIEKNNKILIKYMNLRGIEEIVNKIACSKINHLGCYQYKQQGLIQKEYKDYVRNKAMKCIETDKKEIDDWIKRLSYIKYDELEYFTCALGGKKIDYFDYTNKVYFYCDRYYPEKYKVCIDFVNYILDECNILNMERADLKLFKEEEIEKIMIELIKEKIEFEGGILV